MAPIQAQQRPQLDPAQMAKLFFSPGSPLDPPPDQQQNPQQQNVQPPAATSAAPGQQDPQQAAAPQNPSFAQPSSGPMSRADFFQQRPHDADAYMPARPVGDLDNVHGLRKALALAFGAMESFGAGMQGRRGEVLGRYADQNQAQRTYDANRGRYQAEAGNQAYGNYLGEAEKTAQTRLTGAQADITGQNLPIQEQAQKAFDTLKQAWINKTVPPEKFQQYAQTELSAMPGNIARMVAPHLGDIQKLPQTGKGYSLTMQDDLPKSVNVYGKEYDRTDPALEQLAPGAGADFDRAMAAHQTKLTETEGKEKRVAGYAAERQGTALAHADTARQQTQTFENEQKGKTEAAKHLQALREAENQNQLVQQLSKSTSPTDQTSLAFKALGLDLPDGVHRINETELNAIRNQGSLGDRAYRALLNWTSGEQFAPDILKDISATANKIAASKVKTANDSLEDVNRNYSYKVPGSDDRGRFDGQAANNAPANQKPPQHKVGDVVTVKGQQIKITTMHSDGTFDGEPVNARK